MKILDDKKLPFSYIKKIGIESKRECVEVRGAEVFHSVKECHGFVWRVEKSLQMRRVAELAKS